MYLELEKSDCAALRDNLVVMMADFCVRHLYCSQDYCRDHVYWGGVLFLRFLLSLVDESEKIRQLAEYLYGNILKVKAPLLAYNSFVEAIFILNACLLILRAHEWRADFFAPLYSARTNLHFCN
ncbi:hypothetical protein CMV_026875 [Castanea mollissima]|uniref:Uncharacterized protein n=1 Tax=Castanea mollissima TaxID=60419 RepID=A0A8J4QKW2_9ROSI|nr:hypothetical protein CMV_026875 [Castanea mollissima]